MRMWKIKRPYPVGIRRWRRADIHGRLRDGS